MASPADRLSDDAARLQELTGTPQSWIALCQEVVATRAAPALLSLIEDEAGPWARALRTGREVHEPAADLSCDAVILDVRAAYAVRSLALYLAGGTQQLAGGPQRLVGGGEQPAAEALAPILAHADAAGLHSTSGCDVARLRVHLESAGRLSRELADVLSQLHQSDHPSAGFVALLACHLTKDLRLSARPDLTVPVLFDVPQRDGAVSTYAGAAGKLSLTSHRSGPPGLHPDPRRMAFFYGRSPAFVTSLRNAWNAAPLADTAACVCWAVTLDLDAEGPANTIEGGSLGGAFGLALHELHARQRHRLGLAHLPGLRRTHLDFRRRVASPRTAVSATVTDTDGSLGPVAGLDNKLAAARRAHLDLVIAHPQAVHTADGDAGVAVETATTVAEALRHARTVSNPRFRSTITALSLICVLTVVLGIATSLVLADSQRRRREVAAERLMGAGVAVRESNPRLALQLGEAAVALNPSAATRASLTATLAESHFVGSVAETNGIQTLAVDPSGRLLASASVDNTLALWRLDRSGAPVRLGAASTTSPVRTIAFAGAARTVVTGDSSNCLAVWDIDTPGRPVLLPWRDPSPRARCGAAEPADGALPKVQDLDVSRDGRVLAAASSDGTLTLFDLSDPARPHRLSTTRVVGNGVWSVAFDPSRDALVTGSADGSVVAWDVADPRSPALLGSVRHEHSDIVRSIAFHPAGGSFVSGSLDNTVRLWSAADLKQLHVIKSLSGHSGGVFRVAYAADGRRFVSASADRTAIVWDATSRQPLATLRGQEGYVRALAFVGSERVLTGSLDGTLTAWDAAAPSQASLAPPVAHEPGKVRAIVFSPDDRRLAAATSTGVIRVHDIVQPALRPVALPRASGSVYSLAFSPDGRLAEGGSSKEQIRVWDLTRPGDPTVLARLSDDHGAVHAVAFDPTGQLLASGSADGTVSLWRPSAEGRAPIGAGRLGREAVTTVAFGDKGRILASGGIDKAVTIWSVAQPGAMEAVGRISDHDEAVYATRYSRDGKVLAVGSADGSTTLWSAAEDSREPSRLARITVKGQTRSIRAVAFSSDGSLLATGGDHGTVEVFALTEPRNPRLLATLPAVHPPPSSDGEGVLALAYGRHTLAVATADGAIRRYDTTVLENLQMLPREIACSRTGEGLSEEAWAVYVPEVPYEDTCDQ